VRTLRKTREPIFQSKAYITLSKTEIFGYGHYGMPNSVQIFTSIMYLIPHMSDRFRNIREDTIFMTLTHDVS
jgi:hypothetical protein